MVLGSGSHDETVDLAFITKLMTGVITKWDPELVSVEDGGCSSLSIVKVPDYGDDDEAGAATLNEFLINGTRSLRIMWSKIDNILD